MTPGPTTTLYDQLLRECDAMAKYAFASGLKMPASVVQELATQLVDDPGGMPPIPGPSTTGGGVAAAAAGQAPPRGNASRGNASLLAIANLHQALATVVAPASPRTILLLAEESASRHWLRFLGPVPLVRHMMVAALISLFCLVGTSLSQNVDDENISQSLLQLSGWPLLWIEAFLVSAAGLGAAFSALFTANRYIVEGTFDPKYKASYWVRFILGVIAGVILADFVPRDASAQVHLHKPLLAILGGFSAALVYRILARLVDTVESLFRGDPRETMAVSEALVKTRAVQGNIRVAHLLMSLHRELGPGADPSSIRARVDRILAELLPGEWVPQPAPQWRPAAGENESAQGENESAQGENESAQGENDGRGGGHPSTGS